MRIRSPRLLLALIVVGVGIQVIPVERVNPPVDPAATLGGDVVEILRPACYDCHSHETRWPWYARVAPTSWLIAHHVDEGREHLNFSLWNGYGADRHRHLAAEILEEVKEGEMPPAGYRRLHPEADLDEAALRRLEAWADSLKTGTPEAD